MQMVQWIYCKSIEVLVSPFMEKSVNFLKNVDNVQAEIFFRLKTGLRHFTMGFVDNLWTVCRVCVVVHNG